MSYAGCSYKYISTTFLTRLARRNRVDREGLNTNQPQKMDNAELYNKNNILQKRDAQQCLEEYAKDMKWKNYSFNVIDIGSGDGCVTSILKTYIPNNCKKLLGCDISEKMVQFASARYAKNSISFKVLNIESDLPEQLREKFDHAFSFYTLHWIKHQELAYSNIYDLLTNGGNCLLLFLGHMPVFEMWRKLVRYPRWSYWMRDIDRYISSYHDCQDPEENVKLMMKNIGFTNVKVKCVDKSFVFTGKDVFKNAMSAVNPFKIPLEMQEDYLEDHVKAVRDMELVVPSNCGDGSFNVKMNYKIITVYAEK